MGDQKSGMYGRYDAKADVEADRKLLAQLESQVGRLPGREEYRWENMKLVALVIGTLFFLAFCWVIVTRMSPTYTTHPTVVSEHTVRRPDSILAQDPKNGWDIHKAGNPGYRPKYGRGMTGMVLEALNSDNRRAVKQDARRESNKPFRQAEGYTGQAYK